MANCTVHVTLRSSLAHFQMSSLSGCVGGPLFIVLCDVLLRHCCAIVVLVCGAISPFYARRGPDWVLRLSWFVQDGLCHWCCMSASSCVATFAFRRFRCKSCVCVTSFIEEVTVVSKFSVASIFVGAHMSLGFAESFVKILCMGLGRTHEMLGCALFT